MSSKSQSELEKQVALEAAIARAEQLLREAQLSFEPIQQQFIHTLNKIQQAEEIAFALREEVRGIQLKEFGRREL